MSEIKTILLSLLERAAAVPVEHDPEWSSPCEVLPADGDGMVQWRPVEMTGSIFADLAVHPDVRELYGSYWGGTIFGEDSLAGFLRELA